MSYICSQTGNVSVIIRLQTHGTYAIKKVNHIDEGIPLQINFQEWQQTQKGSSKCNNNKESN